MAASSFPFALSLSCWHEIFRSEGSFASSQNPRRFRNPGHSVVLPAAKETGERLCGIAGSKEELGRRYTICPIDTTTYNTMRHINLNKVLPSHSYRCYFRRAKLQDWSNGEESSIPSKEPITSITSHSHNFILGTTKKSINQSFDASLLVALYTNKQTNKHARNHHYYTY